MTIPVQPDQIDENRQAVAPYNFVPLPEMIVTQKVNDLPDQGMFHPDRLTGYLDCELTTESPVFVRAGVTPEQAKAGKQSKDLPDFFFLDDKDEPVIPGSSLRGMLRTLVEIVTFSKVSFVSDKKLVYRSVGGATNHDKHYRDMMMRDDGEHDRKKHYTPLIRGGYMVKKGARDWAIRPAKEVDGTTYAHLRIDENLFRSLKRVPHTRNAQQVYIRTAPYDYQNVRGGFLRIKYARVLEAKANPAPGLLPGTLAISGRMFSKRTEAVIYEPDLTVEPLDLDDDQIDAYTEQISPEQEKLLGKKGALNDGQPVFYITDKDGHVVFFGHARMFRVPYPKSPLEHIPLYVRESQSPEVVDWAEAIFGYTRNIGEGRQRAYAGRVSFTDARLVPGQIDIWLDPNDKTIAPKILSGPKPTTFQHYLVQTEPNNYKIGETRDGKPKYETRLRDFASPTPGETVIRGHKFYWHKGAVTAEDIQEPQSIDWEKDTQHTRINPLRAGVSFKFRLKFENLSSEELGALMFVLDVLATNEKTRLKIGMGKPLGMGAAKITSKLIVVDAKNRYQTLFHTDGWAGSALPGPEKAQQALQDFMVKMERELNSDLLKTKRIRELLYLLQWPGPDHELTRYMEIEYPDPKEKKGKRNEYRDRPVLPTPFGVWSKKK